MTDKAAEPRNIRSPNIPATAANWIYRILGSFGATYLSGVTFNLVADFEHTHRLTWEIVLKELLLENVLPLVRTQPYVLALVLVLLSVFILTSLVLFPRVRTTQDPVQAASATDDKDVPKDEQASWTPPNIPLLQKPLIGRRQQVARVVDLLRNDRAVVALYGLPGIGRYSVARAAIEEVVRGGRFTDGMLEVNCSDVSTAVPVLKQIIRRFSDGNLIPVNDDLDALQRNVVDVFRERDALVLLRDVPEEVNQAHLLRPLREARATIVMTVPSRPPVTLIPFESAVEIEPLGSTEAVALLLDLYRRSGRTLSASEIASDAPKIALDLLGGHPKAIELVAERAAHNRQNFHRTAAELEKRMGSGRSGKGIEFVASSLGLSRLVQDVEPHARTLCIALGAFATHDFDRRAVASLAQSLKGSSNQAINYLLDHALLHVTVDPREPTAAERLTVHPLIEVCIRAEFSTLQNSDVLKIRRELLAYYARSVEHMSDDERRSELANMQCLLKQSAGQADKIWHKLIVKVCAGLGNEWLAGCSPKDGDSIIEVGLGSANWCGVQDSTPEMRSCAARVYYLAGQALELRGELARAAAAYRKSRETYTDIGDQFEAALLMAAATRVEAARFEQEGGARGQSTLLPVALEAHDAADRIRGANLSRIKQDIARSACLAQEAWCRLLLKETWHAESLAREAIALVRHYEGCNEASYPLVHGEVAHITAQITWHAGKLDDAMRYAVEAYMAFGSVSDLANKASALCTAGGIAVWQHDLSAAEDFYFEALRKAEIVRADRVEKEARLWLNLVRWSASKIQGADDSHKGAHIMHIYRTGSAERTFEGLREMQQGRLSHAAKLFHDALRRAETDDDLEAQCLIYHHLAMITVKQGGRNTSGAVQLLRRSRELRSRLAS